MTTAYLVTGTTRGIGRAVAEVIRGEGGALFSLSSAPDRSSPNECNIQCDLSLPAQVVDCGTRLIKMMCQSSADALVLINNAAVLAPMGPMELLPAERIVRHLHVNQAAPALLMSAFISLTAPFCGKRSIINISSGAARNAYSGWALYCGSKAALDMMTLCVAREQQGRERSVSVCCVYPGKVDTDMQALIRETDPSLFPAQADFVRAKQSGELIDPLSVARLILDLHRMGRFDNGSIYDLRSARVSEGQLCIDPLQSAFGP